MNLSPSKRSQFHSLGFSLLELLIALGVIMVLAALLFPAVRTFRETGTRNACLSNMRQLSNVITQYSADNSNRLLPAAAGANGWMNDTVWYEMLDAAGYLAANPYNTGNRPGDLWNNKRNSIMSCPARDQAPASYWAGGRHAVHFTVNQNPGFMNRVNFSTGEWPTLARIAQPSRTYLLAEANFPVAYPNGDNFVYPHPRKGKAETDGEGLNLVFYDGHAEYLKGRMPVIGSEDYSQVPYSTLSPDQSFPWF